MRLKMASAKIAAILSWPQCITHAQMSLVDSHPLIYFYIFHESVYDWSKNYATDCVWETFRAELKISPREITTT